eukprot:scaffold11140_cov51-Cyclotella_meneghiniana.AAC.5
MAGNNRHLYPRTWTHSNQVQPRSAVGKTEGYVRAMPTICDLPLKSCHIWRLIGGYGKAGDICTRLSAALVY